MGCVMWEGVGEAGEDDPGVRMVVVVVSALGSSETVVSLEGYWARCLHYGIVSFPYKSTLTATAAIPCSQRPLCGKYGHREQGISPLLLFL